MLASDTVASQKFSRGSWRIAVLALATVLVVACAPKGNVSRPPTPSTAPLSTPAHVAVVDPSYIYEQLDTMTSRYQHREAGFREPGHDGFANYWAQELTRDLDGYGPVTTHDNFSFHGWGDKPPSGPATNVEVSVPGLTHPEQIVVIGCHYDGEAFSSQSAFDDASGCAIELGVAKALAASWRTNHTAPARTLRFIAFDAEESGIYGSYHYLNQTANGDIGSIVAMFDEEQNGIAYPLRFLGKTKNPLLPFYVDMSPAGTNDLYPDPNRMTSAQQMANGRFRAELAASVGPVFGEFRGLGFSALTYRDNSNQSVSQPIFTADQQSNIKVQDDELGGSDEIVFTDAGLPAVTYAGNYSYYFGNNVPAWSYPYDQPQDTLQLMNVYASGHAAKSQALALALALPAMCTTWMLAQPDVLGEGPADGNPADGSPAVLLADVGKTVAGQSITLDASGTVGSALTARWDFGDGAQASGLTVSHTYAMAGEYTLTLTVRSAKGSRVVHKTLHVASTAPFFPNPDETRFVHSMPRANPSVVFPTPEP